MGQSHHFVVMGLGDQIGNIDFPWTDSTGRARAGNPFTNGFHHGVAHHDYNAESNNVYQGQVAWHARKIRDFAIRLRNTPDIDGGNMLDNTLIVLTGEVGDGTHNCITKGYTLIGGRNMGLAGGRLIVTPRFQPRDRRGFVYGGQLRNGSTMINTINYGPPISMNHEADLWVSIARIFGATNLNTWGHSINNYMPIRLTA